MALAKQNVPVILGGGIDTKTDEKVVQPGRLLALENGRFTKIGTLTKRFGYDDLNKTVLGGTDITAGKAVAAYFNELVLMDGQKLYSYVASNDAFADRGICTAVGVRSLDVIRNTASQKLSDVATTRGVTVYAWEDSRGGVRATVIDESSGLPIQADIVISATASRPRVSSTADFLFVHYMDAASTFKVQRLNPLSPLAFETAVTVASDANATNPNFDISRYGTYLVCSYETTGNVIKTGFLKSDGTIGSGLDGFPASVTTAQSGSGAICVVGVSNGDANDGVYLFYHNTTDGLRCRIYNTDLTTSSTTTVDSITTVVNQITALISGASCHVWYEVSAGATYNIRLKADSITRAGVAASGGTGQEFVRSLGLSGKAFEDNSGNIFLIANHASTLQPTYFTLRHISATRAFVVNTIAPENASGVTVKRSHVSNIASVGSGDYLFPALVKSRLISESGQIYGQVGVQSVTLVTEDPAIYQTKVLGRNLHIAGGLLFNYDGRTCFEHGYNLFPENLSNAITAAGGVIEAGTRQYAAVYEWTDNQGQVHQSAPSVGLSVTNILNDSNTLTIPTLRVTEKKSVAGRSEVSIALYRTKASGTVFYRVSSISSPTLNSVTSDTVTIADTAADTTIGANEILYTTGGILEDIQPQSCTVLEDFGGRLVTNVSEDDTLTSFSRKWVKNESVIFNDSLNFRAPQGGGGISGYKAMDEKLIILKDSSLYGQVGRGPTDTGDLNDFEVPQLINSDVGCPYPQSIVTYPDGIIFKSKKGFYALTRGLKTEYIGAQVEEFNNLTVTGAVLVDDQNEVRFFHSDGRALIYDFYTKQWGTDTGLEAVSAVMWQNRCTILRSDGTILSELKTTYKDAGSPIKMRLVTPWLSAAGLQSAQRVYRALFIGELKSPHLLRIKVAYDFQDETREQFIFNTEEILGSNYFGEDAYYGSSEYYGSVDPLYQVEIRPFIQKCESIRFELDDLNPESVDGAGFTITGLLIEVGKKAGTFRLPQSKRLAAS